MVTADLLIKKGYFPMELVPSFKTESLARSLPYIEIKQDKSKSKCCLYSIPRAKYLRRQLSIPNPLHQIKLCKILENNWNDIRNFIEGPGLSCSKPTEKRDSERALNRFYEFDELKAESIQRSIDSRVYLKTDLSRYYSTIYTHSIPWALHTKEAAKQDYKCPSLYGNCIDEAVRNTQDGQTHGIPTGPDSSFIIAEIIGAALDYRLIENCPNLKGYRYMDDYVLFFKNRSEAEDILSKLHSVCGYFALEINPEKTKIEELPDYKNDFWVSELERSIFRQNKEDQKKDLLNYFEKSFDYSKKYPMSSVLKFALSNIGTMLIDKENWLLYESFILSCITLEPISLPIATGILVAYKEKGYPLNESRISSTIEEIIKYHSNYSNSYEISWALWLSKCLNISINVAEEISKCDSSIIALIALDLKNKGLISPMLDVSKWKFYLNFNGLYSDHWLLAYESSVKNWLTPDDGVDYIGQDDFFSSLRNNNVEFYDVDAKPNPIEFKEEQIPKDQNIIINTPGYWRALSR